MDTRRYLITKTAYAPNAFQAGYYALNPKNGIPWQRYRPIFAGADVSQYPGDRARYFSTYDKAHTAVEREIVRSKKTGTVGYTRT